MRIAVIGSGIAGLAASSRLASDHEITVFEAGDHVGGHTNTIDVEVGGERHAIDTGFIVFNERHYPMFTQLIESLGVASQASTMSFSVRCDRTGLEYNGTSLDRLFVQRRNLLRPSFHRMILDILRFNQTASVTADLPDDSVTVDEYVGRNGFGTAFVEHYLVPLGASLWSCPPRTFLRFPVRFVLEFLDNHAMLQVHDRPVWRVIQGGSRRYVERLIRPFADRIRLSCPIRSVRRRSDHVELADETGALARFDHAIVACHADQALALLADPTAAEREVLGAFPYQPNTAVVHTDTAVLPRRRRAWASWNYRIPADEPEAVQVTYDMNLLQSLTSAHTFLVTLNDEGRIRPDRVLRRIAYSHPVFTAGRDRAQRRHRELIDANRTSFCGAYWGYGFHEDGVASGLAVSDALRERRAA